VGAKSSPGDVITRISELLHPESPNLNASQRVTLKAIDKAIPKAILAAEMIRDFIADVHQINELSNISIQEVYESRVNGLDNITHTKTLALLAITLTLKPTPED
jgi:DNA-binding protein